MYMCNICRSEIMIFLLGFSPRPTKPNPYKNVTTTKGHNIQFVCDVEAVPEPAFQWSKDGVLVEENSMTSFEQGRKVLSLSTVNETDDGWYTCEAENYLGSTRFSYQLTVFGNNSSTYISVSNRYDSGKIH